MSFPQEIISSTFAKIVAISMSSRVAGISKSYLLQKAQDCILHAFCRWLLPYRTDSGHRFEFVFSHMQAVQVPEFHQPISGNIFGNGVSTDVVTSWLEDGHLNLIDVIDITRGFGTQGVASSDWLPPCSSSPALTRTPGPCL